MTDPELPEIAARLIRENVSDVETLFALLDRAELAPFQRTESIRALIVATRQSRHERVHQLCLATGNEWREVPSLGEVVIRVDARTGVHVELHPHPYPSLLSWSATVDSRTTSLDALRSQIVGLTSSTIGQEELQRLAVALRQLHVGVPFAAGRVIECASAVHASRILGAAPGLNALAAECVGRLSSEIAELPRELVRRLDSLRLLVPVWATAVSDVFPEAATALHELRSRMPAGLDEPEIGPPDSALCLLESPAPVAALPRSYRGDTTSIDDPAVNVYFTPTTLVTGVFGAQCRPVVSGAAAAPQLRLPVTDLAADRLARLSDAQLQPGTPLEKVQAWWALRMALMLRADEPTFGAAARDHFPLLSLRFVADGEEVGRVPLVLVQEFAEYRAVLPELLPAHDVVIALADEPTLDWTLLESQVDRLIATGLFAAAAYGSTMLAYVGRPALPVPSRAHQNDSFRALAASRAAKCVAQVDRADAARDAAQLRTYARRLASPLVDRVLEVPGDVLQRVDPVVDLPRLRGTLAARVTNIIRSDPHGLQIDDVREMGTLVCAIDRALAPGRVPNLVVSDTPHRM